MVDGFAAPRGAARFAPLKRVEPLLRAEGDEMRRVQKRYLSRALRVAWNEIPFYQELWRKRGGGQAPRRLEDWPTWNVSDLREAIASAPPFGSLYVPSALKALHFINSSSGTTGVPRLVPMTAIDVPGLTDVYRRHFEFTGVRSSDTVCVTWSFSPSAAAWSATRGAWAVGAGVVPASSGNVTPSEKLAELIVSTRSTVVAGSASYLLHVAQQAKANGIDLPGSPVRLLFLSAESAPPPLRDQLMDAWGGRATLTYANTDTSWVASECTESADRYGELGGHIFEDIASVEILDQDGQPVGPGEYGELVITSWARAASPRIRFRTGDRAAIDPTPCVCGRTAPRLLPLAGRVDHAIRYHGQTIWPSSLESCLHAITGERREYCVERRDNGTVEGTLVLLLELPTDADTNAEHLAVQLRHKLNVRFQVELVEPGSTAQLTGVSQQMKVQRYFDRRADAPELTAGTVKQGFNP